MKKIIYLTMMVFCLSNQAVAADNNTSKTSWSQSYTLERNGEYEKAAAVLEPLLQEGDDQEYALMRYAWLHYMQGNFNDAIRNYKKALKQNPRSLEARLGLYFPLAAQNRWQEASRYLKQVLALSPYHYTAHIRLMICEEALRHWQDLEKHALSLAVSYPSDASILVYLARSYAWQDKKEHAVSTYLRVLARYPNNFEANGYVK